MMETEVGEGVGSGLDRVPVQVQGWGRRARGGREVTVGAERDLKSVSSSGIEDGGKGCDPSPVRKAGASLEKAGTQTLP